MGKTQRKKKPVTGQTTETRSLPIPENRTSVNTEDIAERAYQLFLERGGVDGHDLDDWIEAERQIHAAVQRTSELSANHSQDGY